VRIKSFDPIFFLDEPQYHRVRLGEVHRFRGVALALGDPPIDSVGVYRDGVLLAEGRVDRPTPELASLLRLPRAANCRFQLDVRVDGGAPYELKSGHRQLFLFDVPLVERDQARLQRLWREVSARPDPSPELVASTQGGGNVDSYRDSIITGLLTMEELLGMAGARPEDIGDILDIGCGTGRMLLGWHCDNPARRLAGTDINAALIDWNRRNLGDVARWQVGALGPPLDVPDASFDLVQLISVFTHLPLQRQRDWLIEIRRLLRPGGSAIITLHGDLYAELMLDDAARDAFYRDGHVEVAGGPEGANAFSAFHTPSFARELFGDFGRFAFFPRGNPDASAPHLFPIAALQDVYVLECGSHAAALG
jgi:SAM-dependent methyltransferase